MNETQLILNWYRTNAVKPLIDSGQYYIDYDPTNSFCKILQKGTNSIVYLEFLKETDMYIHNNNFKAALNFIIQKEQYINTFNKELSKKFLEFYTSDILSVKLKANNIKDVVSLDPQTFTPIRYFFKSKIVDPTRTLPVYRAHDENLKIDTVTNRVTLNLEDIDHISTLNFSELINFIKEFEIKLNKLINVY